MPSDVKKWTVTLVAFLVVAAVSFITIVNSTKPSSSDTVYALESKTSISILWYYYMHALHILSYAGWNTDTVMHAIQLEGSIYSHNFPYHLEGLHGTNCNVLPTLAYAGFEV